MSLTCAHAWSQPGCAMPAPGTGRQLLSRPPAARRIREDRALDPAAAPDALLLRHVAAGGEGDRGQFVTHDTVHVFVGGVEEKLVANKAITQFVEIMDSYSKMNRLGQVRSRGAHPACGFALAVTEHM